MAESNFNYDVPGLLDMENIHNKNEDVEKIELYFEFDHEQNETSLFTTPPECNGVALARLSKSMGALIVDDESNVMEEDHEVRGEEEAANNKSQNSIVKQGRDINISRLNELAKPKSSNYKFVSVNEGTHKFQVSTPLRFRTQPLREYRLAHVKAPVTSTIPQSPVLATKNRSRPLHVLSANERENNIVQEMLKFKLKANPVNRKVLEPLKPVHLNSKALTAAVTPTVLKRFPGRIRPQSVDRAASASGKSPKATRTIMEPFSFDKRDMNKALAKERMIQQQFEEEKKAREFKAHPMPKAVYSGPRLPVKQLVRGMGSLESVRSNKSDDIPKFIARPAVSLLVSPFVPKPSNKPKTQIESFTLISNQRVQERRNFDERMKEKHEKLRKEALLREIEQNNQLFQAERKLTIQKARPIKKYKPVVPISAKGATIPITPAVLRTKAHNKEN